MIKLATPGSAVSFASVTRHVTDMKKAMEKKGLRVNGGKTKVVICGTGLFRGIPMHYLSYRSRQQQHLLQWLQTLGAEKLQRNTTTDTIPYYRCAWCRGTAPSIEGRPQSEVQVRHDKLEVVASFCYLDDMLSAESVK